MIIGLSTSASPDLVTLGFGSEHLRAAMVEIAQQLLVAGHDLAYGGDLRPGGFTMDLMQLVRAYAPPTDSFPEGGHPPELRVRSYLAWPIPRHAPTNDLADVAAVARLVSVEPPPIEAASEGETAFTLARGLNDMRQRMTEDIDARIALGGKTSGFSGLLPGVTEEVLLMLEKRKPVYLFGAFGGCTSLVIEALRGGTFPGELTAEGVESNWAADALESRRALVQAYADKAPSQPGFDRLKKALTTNGMANLCNANGLSPEENELLFKTPDHQLLIALVLKGLAAIKGG